jgi:saccharopine dehydrogenase-like NADP-dependent oxidoreductase
MVDLKRQITLLNHALTAVNQCGLPPGVDPVAHWNMVTTLRDEITTLGEQLFKEKS